MTALQEMTYFANHLDVRYPINKKVMAIWKDEYLRVTLHSFGVLPKYCNVDDNDNEVSVVYPANYTSEYDAIFDSKIFYKHQNLSKKQYNYLRRAYPDFSRDLMSKFISKTSGVIFTNGNYIIDSKSDDVKTWLNEISFNGYCASELLTNSINDPNGYFVCLKGASYGDGENKRPYNSKPFIEFINSSKLLQIPNYQSNVLIYQNDAGQIIFIDSEFYYVLTKDSKGELTDTDYSFVRHNLGMLPAFEAIGIEAKTLIPADDNKTNRIYKRNSFTEYKYKKSIISGSLSFLENAISEFIDNSSHAKMNYVVTHTVEPTCRKCNGSKVNSNGKSCDSCGGRGTLKIAPGTGYVTDEEKIVVMNTSQDYVRYYNPDTTVERTSWSRFEGLWNKFENSIYLGYTEQAQSGYAKRIDKEDEIKFFTMVSNMLFNVIKKALKAIHGYILYSDDDKYSNILLSEPMSYTVMTAQEMLQIAALAKGIPEAKPFYDSLMSKINKNSLNPLEEKKNSASQLFTIAMTADTKDLIMLPEKLRIESITKKLYFNAVWGEFLRRKSVPTNVLTLDNITISKELEAIYNEIKPDLEPNRPDEV